MPSKNSPAILRNAHPSQARELTALAVRSKRSWGYDDEFMRRIHADMRVEPEMFATSEVFVVQARGELLGYARVRTRAPVAWLHDLFVEPQAMGRGLGRLLFDETLRRARGAGAAAIEFVSDPYAENFYLHLGARRVGTQPSILGPGRQLPLMRVELRAAAVLDRSR